MPALPCCCVARLGTARGHKNAIEGFRIPAGQREAALRRPADRANTGPCFGAYSGLPGRLFETGRELMDATLFNGEFYVQDVRPEVQAQSSHDASISMGGQPKTMIFSFEQKLPATAKMKLYLLTSRSVVAFPFKLTGVPLP